MSPWVTDGLSDLVSCVLSPQGDMVAPWAVWTPSMSAALCPLVFSLLFLSFADFSLIYPNTRLDAYIPIGIKLQNGKYINYCTPLCTIIHFD